MVKMKHMLLMLVLASAALPAHAMDSGGDDGKGFFGRVVATAQEHPVIVISLGLLTAGGIALVRKLNENYKNSRLFTAAAWGNLAQVQELVAQGADVNAFGGLQGLDNAFHCAIRSGRKDVIVWLLQHGANKHIRDDVRGELPIEIAERANNQEIVRVLLCHFDVPVGKPVSEESRKRVITTLCVFNKTDLPKLHKDIQLNILAYLPEDVLSKEHCRLIMNKGANLQALVDHCPFTWFKAIYNAFDAKGKESIVSAYVDYHLRGRLDAQEFQDEVAQNVRHAFLNDQIQ